MIVDSRHSQENCFGSSKWFDSPRHSANMNYDLILQGGHVVDPAQQINFVTDIAIQDGVIAELGENLATNPSTEQIDASGMIVCPGLIDLHVHCYSGMGLFSVDAAEIGLKTGVTTLLDTGSAGCLNYGPFHRFVMPAAREDVFALLNIAQHGVQGHPDFLPYLGDLHDAKHIHAGNAIACIDKHRDRIVGVKARLTESLTDGKPENEYIAMNAAIDAGEATGLPCMFHHLASSIPLEELLEIMRPGDILTHFYHGKGDGGFVPNSGSGAPSEAMLRAREKRILFDVGHGVGAFTWRIAEPACRQHGFFPDTISTDLHQFCIDGPTYDLPTTMSKLLHLGMPLEKVIEATTITPARAIKLHDRGSLAPGLLADISLLRMEDGEFDLVDVEGAVRTAAQRLVHVGTIKSGVVEPCLGS